MLSEEKKKLSLKSDLCTLTLMEVEGAASVNKSNGYLMPIMSSLMEKVSRTLEFDLHSFIRKTAWPSKTSQLTAQGCVSRYLNMSFEDALDEFLTSTPFGLKMIVEQLCSSSSVRDLNEVLDMLVDEDDAFEEPSVNFYDNTENEGARRSNLTEAICPNDYNQPRLHFEKLSNENVQRIHEAYATYAGDYLIKQTIVEAYQRAIGQSIFARPFPFTVVVTGEEEKFYKMKFQINLLPPEVRPMKEILVIREADKLLTYMLEARIGNPRNVHSIINRMEIPRTLAMDIGEAFDSLRGKYEQAETLMSLPPHV